MGGDRGSPPAPGPDRFDERDTMFARAALEPGTPAHDAYYARRPHLREVDDRLRALPPLCAPGGRFFEPRAMAAAQAHFDAIETFVPDAGLVARLARRLGEAGPAGPAGRDDAVVQAAAAGAVAAAGLVAAAVKAMARELGALAAGWAPLAPAFVYSHKGRFPSEQGRPITLDHPSALLFLVEMDLGAMRRAPLAETLRESARQYERAAAIARTLAAALQAAGWEAKAHYDAHYDAILPPLAELAGLGEVGRNNILIADRVGSRCRIGAVTTTLPVRPDRPVLLGVARFCELCGKCAHNCPAGALSTGPRELVRGAWKWPTDVERCYRYWRTVGTDCGVCMAVCPFSHADNAFHNVVRWSVRRLPWAHRALLAADEAVYGRRWRAAPGPDRNRAGRD